MATRASQQAIHLHTTSYRQWPFNWKRIWTSCLLLICVVLLGLGVRKLREPQTLPIKRILAMGNFEHINVTDLRHVVAMSLNGGYFSVNVGKVQKAVETIPWVDRDSVRKIWPDTLSITVTEQTTEAIWARGGLVNQHGVLFFPKKNTYPKGLPVFDGPVGTERNLTESYQMANAIISPLKLQITEIHMDGRRALSLKLNNGIDVILGRNATRARLERFARVYSKLLVKRASDIAHVDMRYSNGLAVGWRSEAVKG